MTKPSLSAIYRQATARRDSGVCADDVARLAAGEVLGQRHDAAVEALAGSPAALLAFRAAREVGPEAAALASAGRTVVALPARDRTARPALAMVAGVMGLAVVAGLLWRAGPEPGVAAPTVAQAADDVIFGVSYEADGAMAARGDATEESIFVDEFGG
jgi:hypothetical protein